MGGKPTAEKQAEQTGQKEATTPPAANATAPAAGKALRAEAGKSPAGGDPAYISAVSIEDQEVRQGKKPIIVTFSEPMVTGAALSAPVAEEDRPFALKPPVSGEGRWLNARSFALMPDREFRRGIRYFLHFKDDLKSLEGRPVRYLLSFQTEGVKLSSLQPEHFNSDKNTLLLNFRFNQPVSGKALVEHLTIKDAATGEILPYTTKSGPGADSDQHVVADLGKYRPRLEVSLRADADADQSYLGMPVGYTGSVSLPEPGGSGAVEVDASSSGPSKINFAYSGASENSEGIPYAYFSLTSAVQGNYRDFITVEPEGLNYILDEDGDRLRIDEGLVPGMRVTVTLKPGLVDAAGRVLAETRRDSRVIGDLDANARFAHHGSYLTPVYGTRLGVNLVNVDKVTVSLKRQYDNNLPFMNLDMDYHARKLMRDLEFQEIPVKSKKNEVQRRALDVAELAKGKRGVFLVTLQSYTEHREEDGRIRTKWESSHEQLVVLTDIGVTARVFPSGITVLAASISSANPLPGADVRIYSASNQLIGQGRTGPDGRFVLQRDQEWDPQLTPCVVTVKHGDGDTADLTFLSLESATQREMPDTALRDYLDKGYEAFVYPPRGVFRPGERVDLKAFVRDADHLPPAPFPVLFRVVSARGLEAARGAATLSAEGGADFFFTLPQSAPTGEYQAYVEIPGQKAGPIGSCAFSVEDFVPPRLEVKVSPREEQMSPAAALPVDLSGRYLFGAPGAGLNYELGYRVTAKAFAPQGWDGYLFGDGERAFDPQVNIRYMTGKLNAEGVAEAAFKAPADWTPPALLNVLLVASIQEDGGRWVTQTGTVTYFPTPFLLGLKQEGENFQPGKPVTMKAAAVDPAGRPTDAGKLTAEISLVQGNWHTVYRNGRYVSLWNERIIAQNKFAVESKNGEASFQFTPRQYGRYLVRVATADGAVAASRRVSAVGKDALSLQDGSGRLDSVDLTLDRPSYRIGDTARLSVKAPYAGTLLLGVERGRQIRSQVIAMDQPATVVDIPVTADMDPNAAITAWVIRPVKEENKEWYTHRANGMISLALSKKPHTLEVSARTPDKALPDKPLSISFTVTDEDGVPVEGEFSAAFIDEGILSLTAFATPDPADFFMARRRVVGSSYDMYDALLRPEARATPLLKPGGDAAQNYQGSLSTQQIFLTAYQPLVRTDANGQGEVRFDVPEYSGKGRLMIVGASGKRFASSATQVRVARDLVVEASAPRAVAPGDVFTLPINLFTLAGENNAALQGTAEVSVKAWGPLKLSGDVEKSLPLNPAGEGQKPAPVSHRLTVEAEALEESGIGVITISVSVPGREDLSFSKNVEVAVRPPYPRTSAARAVLLKPGETAVLSVPGKWLKGSVNPSFSISGSPALAVLPALEYLREYPYGCLEQTTSRAWPYLVMAPVQKLLYPKKEGVAPEDVIEPELAGAVARILSMQTPEGGFGLWPGRGSPDPWKSVNATFFLVEARIGTAVPKSALDGALSYLRLLLAMQPSEDNEAYDYSVKAYAAFVLTRAGEPPLSWLQHLSEHEDKMYPSGRIFLAGAKALKAGNPAALKALEAKDGKALNLAGLDLGYNETMESELRNNSLRLLMWSLVAPGDAETARLCASVANGIAAKKRFNPQDAGMASLAVGYYLIQTGISGKPYTADIIVDGNTLFSIAGGHRLILGSRHLPLSGDGQPPALTVAVGKENQAYTVYGVRGVPMDAPKPESSGLAVRRVWKDAQGNVIDLSSGTARVKKGDRIIVELTVKPGESMSHIALSDLLPGGMEVENPRLKTAAGAAEGEDGEKMGSGFYVDLREDRLLVFFDSLWEETTYTYSMRAVSQGTFVLPPLAADAMYDSEVHAVTTAGTVIVE